MDTKHPNTTRRFQRPVDVSKSPDGLVIALLCAFNETVFTKHGRITPGQTEMILTLEGRRPRAFKRASGAIEVLRRAGKVAL